jgi:dipeptidyl aminopeptidase/acylaminoacyl peptidase
MKKPSSIIVMLLSLVIISGCSNSVIYDKENNLELYYRVPATKRPSGGYPAIVFIHGFGSNKDTMLSMVEAAAGHGYFAIAIDWREPDGITVKWPKPLSDSVNAVSWLTNDTTQSQNWSKSNPYKIDMNRIAVVGHSAGGLYSLWLARDERISAVISLAGPTNLESLYRFQSFNEKEDFMDPFPLPIFDNTCIDFLTGLLGPYERIDMNNDGIPDYDPDYFRASPINFPDTCVPILLIHGKNDNYVPLSQSRTLMTTIRKLGGICDLVVFNWGHFLNPGMDAPFCPALEIDSNSGIEYPNSLGYSILDIMLSFLDATLK